MGYQSLHKTNAERHISGMPPSRWYTSLDAKEPCLVPLKHLYHKMFVLLETFTSCVPAGICLLYNSLGTLSVKGQSYFVTLRNRHRRWQDDLPVKSTHCSCPGLGLVPSPYMRLTTSATPVPGQLMGTRWHTYIRHMVQEIHTCKAKIISFLKIRYCYTWRLN